MRQIVLLFDQVPLAAGVESQVERLESPFVSPAHHAGFHVRPGHLTLGLLDIVGAFNACSKWNYPTFDQGVGD